MAQGTGNTAVPADSSRDRVAMLSIDKTGQPDQHNPELIGDREFALEATREQFRQQAVSAVDDRARAAAADNTGAEQLEQDPSVAELQAKHEAAQKEADAAAERTVAELFVGDDPAPAAEKPKAARKDSSA